MTHSHDNNNKNSWFFSDTFNCPEAENTAFKNLMKHSKYLAKWKSIQNCSAENWLNLNLKLENKNLHIIIFLMCCTLVLFSRQHAWTLSFEILFSAFFCWQAVSIRMQWKIEANHLAWIVFFLRHTHTHKHTMRGAYRRLILILYTYNENTNKGKINKKGHSIYAFVGFFVVGFFKGKIQLKLNNFKSIKII